MPTFRNDTKRWIDFRPTLQTETGPQKVLVRFAPDDEKKLRFWLPWREKGLTLVDANDPPVPVITLTSGTYDFEPGMTREFQIPPCDKYVVDLIVQSGRVKLYAGDDPAGADVERSDIAHFKYHSLYDWEQAPRLRLAGMEDGTRATIHVEVARFLDGREKGQTCR